MRWIILFLFSFTLLFSEAHSAKEYPFLNGMPGFSDSLLRTHFKIYEGHVARANESGALTAKETGREKKAVRWHELYFDNLGGDGRVSGDLPLIRAITLEFGGYESWKKEFVALAAERGGGWVFLCFNPNQGRLMNYRTREYNDELPGEPILVMDVFEHAYASQYGVKRKDYIEAFFANVHWKKVCLRYCEAKKGINH